LGYSRRTFAAMLNGFTMRKLSAGKHVTLYVASLVLFVVVPVLWTGFLMALDGIYGIKPSQGVAVLTMGLYVFCTLQFVVVQIAYYFWLLAKMWRPLQDGVTPVTVGKAIGFSFIPIFRVYWWFVSWGSYPEEYNAFVRRRGLSVPPLKSSIFMGLPILITAADFLVFPMLFVPFGMIAMILAVCRANNALAEAVQ
jgi:hypothetical protein